MTDVIWQVGDSMDEKVAAAALQAKNNAVLVTTRTVNTELENLGHGDRLQIVADMSLITGKASGMSPAQMAEFLIAFGLKKARHISLVICNSAVNCVALGGRSFMEVLREALIQEVLSNTATAREDRELYIGTISGRVGYVNVYNASLSVLNIEQLIADHFKDSKRSKESGRKYVHTEPTLLSKYNEFVPKGENKKMTKGIAVMEGVNVGG